MLEKLVALANEQPVHEFPAAFIVGYLAYHAGHHIEDLPRPALGSNEDGWFGLYDACVTYDMQTGNAWLTATGQAALDRLVNALHSSPITDTGEAAVAEGPQCLANKAQYATKVDRIREYIAAGDVYQVNLSHKIVAPLTRTMSAPVLYQRLRSKHTACFGAYLDTGRIQILSNSPECFLTFKSDENGHHVKTWPLKGTRPAATDPAELIACPKERAEHIMIVDLERNDLGRIAVPGSVQVSPLFGLASHPTVHHLESCVAATAPTSTGLVDVLRAMFPGGSISGAPKIRAMEIIDELEQERRGPYCGALGFVDYGGRYSTWNIPIRTAVIEDSQLSVRVGGGVVADSLPALEYEETIVKGRAFFDVLTTADSVPRASE